MASQRLLLLDASGVGAYRAEPGGPVLEAQFASGNEGLQAFADYLQLNASSLYYVLADVPEEGFVVEDVPYVQGSDRQEILQRKMAQHFFGSPLAMAISQGRLQQGRRDERVLFAGLTGYASIEPWLQAMLQLEVRLGGLYSAPQVLADMAAKITVGGSFLLISFGRTGVRQTFFDKGLLRFSRLTPITATDVESVAAICVSETTKISQYLIGQRLITRDAPLRTVIVARPADFEIIGTRYRGTTDNLIEPANVLDLARHYRLSPLPVDSCADRLLLHLLTQRRPARQFAPAANRHHYRLWQARLGILAVAGTVFAGCLAVAGINAFRLSTLAEQTRDIRAELDLDTRRHVGLQQELPKVPISADRLRALTDRQALLMRRSPGLLPALQHVSQALERAPAVTLQHLEWRLAGATDDETAGKAKPTAGSLGNDQVIVRLQAQLPPTPSSKQRAQLESVQGLVGDLARKDVQVQVLSLPLETESGKSIRSSELNTEIAPPTFLLRIAHKL
jgi:hypothetical protein